MQTTPYRPVTTGLFSYIGTVAGRIGSGAVATTCDITPAMATAAVQLRAVLPMFPELPLLLTWDEVDGWALRIGTDEEGTTVAVCYLGSDILPDPSEVETFVCRAVHDELPGTLTPPSFRVPNEDDRLSERVAAFSW